MKLSIALVLAVVSLFNTNTGIASTIDEVTLQRIQTQFPERIESLYYEQRLRGDLLVAVVDANGLRYAYTLNQRGASPESNGLTTTTPFLTASHTKAFTGTLAQVLVQQGRFDLDAPLDRYLADEIHDDLIATDDITIKQLLNHTAGFTSSLHTFKSAFLGYVDETDLVAALNHETLIAPAGVFRYSNTGPIVAARAMEKATGISWQELVKEELFTPLVMQQTSTRVSDYPQGTILPIIEVGRDGEIVRSGLHKTDQTLHAAGGTISTLADMAKWLQFNVVQGQQLATLPAFFQPLHQSTTTQERTYFTYERTGYSLAWDIADYHGKSILTRFGGFGGISVHASFIPADQIAVVAFFNDERGYLLPHVAANYLYNLALTPTEALTRFETEVDSFKESVEREQAQSLDQNMQVPMSEQWQQNLGRYEAGNGWPPLEIFVKDDMLWLRWGALNGPLYNHPEDLQSFTVALGPLRRTITVGNDEQGVDYIRNGSIEYRKRSQ